MQPSENHFKALQALSACVDGEKFVVTFNEKVLGGAHLTLSLPLDNAAGTLRGLGDLAAELAAPKTE